jgi:signal peptidase I
VSQGAQAKPAVRGGVAREIGEIAILVLAALATVVVVRALLFQAYSIPSASMEPSLYEGDYIIVSKYSYGYSKHSFPLSPPLFHGRLLASAPRRGDIVVFKLPREADGSGEDYAKRLIGLPGDRIQLKHSLVYINGQPVIRAPAAPGTEDMGHGVTGQVARFSETLPGGRTYLTDSYGDDGPADNTGVYVVPPHCYFMLGDNRDNSLDSRFDPDMPAALTGSATCGWNGALDSHVPNDSGVGFVPEEDLVGRARIVLFSWSPGAAIFKPWTWFHNFRADRALRPLP